jgi:hypothetical protein
MRPACSGDNRNRSKEVGVIDINWYLQSK